MNDGRSRPEEEENRSSGAPPHHTHEMQVDGPDQETDRVDKEKEVQEVCGLWAMAGPRRRGGRGWNNGVGTRNQEERGQGTTWSNGGKVNRHGTTAGHSRSSRGGRGGMAGRWDLLPRDPASDDLEEPSTDIVLSPNLNPNEKGKGKAFTQESNGSPSSSRQRLMEMDVEDPHADRTPSRPLPSTSLAVGIDPRDGSKDDLQVCHLVTSISKERRPLLPNPGPPDEQATPMEAHDCLVARISQAFHAKAMENLAASQPMEETQDGSDSTTNDSSASLDDDMPLAQFQNEAKQEAWHDEA
ncbi:hypothetical protein J5N97_026889 [Dioscorea zingiberensis]|uniref:Uncharacterized protein n=1 Tax=Dioscorea zingiberensis TaxID=325984 RepID=A0A9D5C361_9LILI|nr:hypothetical protein J5N97_026889 [Dioscorea zingiberensis]